MGQHKHNTGQRRLTVTVCIPTILGREQLLMRARTSVAEQTRAPDSVMVRLDKDRSGAAVTRNRLLEHVTTDVIAWLDDDDRLAPRHIAACMRVLENTDADLVYPAPYFEGMRDPTAVTYQGVFPTSPWGLRWQPELEQHIRDHGSFIPITHLVRTGAVRAAGGFPDGRVLPDGRYQGEDERYLLSLLDHGARFEHLDRRTWFWSPNPESTAGRGQRIAMQVPQT
jgi:glycosyltransferase involved in cell wall biosynthesis